MFGGHYDGHEIAQAAFDCGAACMASLEIGRVLNEVRDRLERSVRIVLFSAEELRAREWSTLRSGPDTVSRRRLRSYLSCARWKKLLN